MQIVSWVCLYLQDSYKCEQNVYRNSLYELFSQVSISDGPNADFGVLRNSSQSISSFIKRGKKGLYRGVYFLGEEGGFCQRLEKGSQLSFLSHLPEVLQTSRCGICCYCIWLSTAQRCCPSTETCGWRQTEVWSFPHWHPFPVSAALFSWWSALILCGTAPSFPPLNLLVILHSK